MKIIDRPLPGIVVLEPTVFGDERGWFYEAWNNRVAAELGIQATFVQDNQSRSARGILRGLHYQVRCPQDKLVRCLVGSIYDVVVDVRRHSATFGQWFGIELNAANKRILWVERGFAHGFLVTSEFAEVHYKVTDYWSKHDERGVRWNDPKLAITWPALETPPTLNARDAAFVHLADIPAADLL